MEQVEENDCLFECREPLGAVVLFSIYIRHPVDGGIVAGADLARGCRLTAVAEETRVQEVRVLIALNEWVAEYELERH